MSTVAAIHTVFNRKSRPRHHVFGQGIPTSDVRQPYTSADLAWAAEALNADDYVAVSRINDLDQRAGEAAWYDSVSGWPTPRGGVSKDANEEAAERWNLPAEEDDDAPFPTLEQMDEYALWQCKVSAWVNGHGERPE